MKKLLNFKTLTMVLLTATTLTATAATTDGVKTNTTTKVSKKVVDYSKMNYNQLKEEYHKIVGIAGTKNDFIGKIIVLRKNVKTDADYDIMCKHVNKFITDITPLQKEINKRVEKYKDNKEAYYIYYNLAEDIKGDILYIKGAVKIAEKNLKEIKMKEMY